MKTEEITNMPPDIRTFEDTKLLVDSSTFIGIEVELEGFNRFPMYPFTSNFWKVTHDGSLRNDGLEFILGVYNPMGVSPLKGKDVIDSLDQLQEWLDFYKREAGSIEVSERTSVHVHIDIRDMDITILRNFIMLYMIFEYSFFSMFGNDRDKNIHCKPMYSHFQYRGLIADILTSDDIGVCQAAISNFHRYGAINLSSMGKLGTLEFRGHPGTTDMSLVRNWVNILLQLKKASFLGVDIEALPNFISGEGLLEFAKGIFDKLFDDMLPYLTHDNLISGIRSAQNILFLESYVRSHRSFVAKRAGKKAGESSLLGKFAKKYNRTINI